MDNHRDDDDDDDVGFDCHDNYDKVLDVKFQGHLGGWISPEAWLGWPSTPLIGADDDAYDDDTCDDSADDYKDNDTTDT